METPFNLHNHVVRNEKQRRMAVAEISRVAGFTIDDLKMINDAIINKEETQLTHKRKGNLTYTILITPRPVFDDVVVSISSY